MKKIFALALIALLAFSGSAFALQCEESQTAGGPDSCWTVATLSNAVTAAQLATGISAGTVMVYDTTSGQLGQNSTLSLAQTGATLVKISTVSVDNTRVAGILQTSLDATKVGSGSQVRLQVRGLGYALVGDSVTSGDSLVVRATIGGIGALGPVGAQTPSNSIATALETSTASNAAKKNVIIHVI